MMRPHHWYRSMAVGGGVLFVTASSQQTIIWSDQDTMLHLTLPPLHSDRTAYTLLEEFSPTEKSHVSTFLFFFYFSKKFFTTIIIIPNTISWPYNYSYDSEHHVLTLMFCHNTGKESSIHLYEFLHALLHVLNYWIPATSVGLII